MGTPAFRRLEAHPFGWSRLTERQKQAVSFMSRLLTEAIDGLAKVQEAGPELDFNRFAQLGFIDGDRGTGKTSILLVLRQLTSPKDRESLAGLPDEVRQLHERRDRLVWLDTLDMEPLSGQANLLAAILARVAERAQLSERRTPGRLRPAFDELDDLEQALSDLQTLEVDAVLAWQGTNAQRAVRTEPNTYAVEVMTNERAGLRLSARFDKVLAKFSKLLATTDKPPLFVLPVDDFDLAPTRCLELLRIVRMVTSSRLFFAIAGNSRIAEIVLRLQGAGELAALADRAFDSLERRSVSLTSMEIAASNLRKLVPPNQRIELTDVSLDEALRFCAGEGTPTLRDALKALPVDRNNAPPDAAPMSLHSFLLWPEPFRPDDYSAAQWLAGKPRQVLDRTHMLTSIPDLMENWGEKLVTELAKDLAREVREHSSLEREQRDQLAAFLTPPRTPRFNFASELAIEASLERPRRIAFPDGYIRFDAVSKFNWLCRDQARLPQSEQPRRFVPVSGHLGAGLTALHDLAVTLWGGYLFPYSIHYQDEGFHRYAAAVWGEHGDEVGWYLPEWWTLREYERWQIHVHAYTQRADSIDEFARAWLAAVLDILFDRRCDASASLANNRLRDDINLLARERPTRGCRIYLRDSALVTTVLLLAPESGCSQACVEQVVGEGSELWTALSGEMIQRIRKWRARVFAGVYSAGDRQIDRRVIRLLCALSPSLGAEAAITHDTSPAAWYPSQNRQQVLEQSQQELGSKEPIKNIRRLRDEGILESWGADPSIAAAEATFNEHLVNHVLDGRLVPDRTDVDVERGWRVSSRQRP
jgi:hypothetical protein